MKDYNYVKCDYNNDEGFWCVDAWRTDDDNEEGKVVAFIHETTGDVAYAEPEARCSNSVKEVVAKKVEEIKTQKRLLYSVTYVTLDDSDYNNNGCVETAVFFSLEEAREHMKKRIEEEKTYLEGENIEYEVLVDSPETWRVAWAFYGEQVRIELHEQQI